VAFARLLFLELDAFVRALETSEPGGDHWSTRAAKRSAAVLKMQLIGKRYSKSAYQANADLGPSRELRE
jgi:hypothetical protein